MCKDALFVNTASVVCSMYAAMHRLFIVPIQVFSYTKKKSFQTDDLCLDVASVSGPVKIFQCHGLGGNQKWQYDKQVTTSTVTTALP